MCPLKVFLAHLVLCLLGLSNDYGPSPAIRQTV
jgi:hypothetical protein